MPARCKPAARLIGSFALLFAAPTYSQTTAPSVRRPNILIILADDLGYSDIGCYGGDVKTPNLDSLAADGARFTSFYNNARCCPTRASLLTGLYPHQAGIGAMNEKTKLPAYSGAIKPTVPTIGEVLKTAGYRTVTFGKWHVSNTLQRPEHMKDLNRLRYPKVFSPIEQYPTRRGFDVYWGDIWGVVDYYNPFSLVDGETAVEQLPDDFYITDAINQHAAAYFRSTKDSSQPFFMYLAHHAPHWPLMAPPETIAKYREQYNDGYEQVREARYARMVKAMIVEPKTTPLSPAVADTGWEQFSPEQKRFQSALFQAHAAMIDRMDQGLGDVFTSLKETGQWDNTLILFLSDNGASPEEPYGPGYDRPSIARDGKPIVHDYKDLSHLAGDEHTFYYIGRAWANVANTPYRKAKASQYNGGERTPMIAHWPTGMSVARGGFVRARGHVMDLMATTLELAGTTMPDQFADATPHALQGKSLVPLLRGEANVPGYPPLFGEHEGGRSVITPDGWKMIRDRGEKEWHLYNLNVDDTELDDVITDHADRAATMQDLWDSWAKENGVLPKP